MPELWTPSKGAPNFLRRFHRPIVRTVTLPNGQRAKVTIDDSRTTKQIETDDALHAIVYPKIIRATRKVS